MSAPEKDPLATLPITNLLVTGKSSFQSFIGFSNSSVETTSLQHNNHLDDALNRHQSQLSVSPVFSPIGNKVCIAKATTNLVCVIDSNCGNLIHSIPLTHVNYTKFSPLGNYLITSTIYKKPSTDSSHIDNNFNVWNVSQTNYDKVQTEASLPPLPLPQLPSCVYGFSQKVLRENALQFSSDENFIFRLVTNEVHIFELSSKHAESKSIEKIPEVSELETHENSLTLTESNNSTEKIATMVSKLQHKGLIDISISPVTKSTTGGEEFVFISIFVPEAGGKPATCTIYKLFLTPGFRIEGPLSSRTMFSASEAKMSWNCTSSMVLIHTQCDVDRTNKSYYGSSGLFFMSATDFTHTGLVPLSKEGAVHDAKWSPLGDRFIVSSGNMPAQCTLFSDKVQPVYEFGCAHRNTICWSPHGRFLCLAGFGNLAGDMDFYDMNRIKKIGTNNSHCTVMFDWSPDSRYFMTASVAPRMNVDNGFKLFKYTGVGPVVHQGFEQIFDVQWQPAPSGTFPNRGPSPKKAGPEPTGLPGAGIESSGLGAPVAKAVGAYRAPGSSSAFADSLRKETGPMGKVKKPVAVDVVAPAAKAIAFAPRQRTIPGLHPPPPDAAKKSGASGSNKGGGNGNGSSKPNKDASVKVQPPRPPVAVAAPITPVVIPVPVVVDSAEEKEKKVKNIRKKLKQIEDLKAKQTGGTALDKDQSAKVNSEASLIEELKSLGI